MTIISHKNGVLIVSPTNYFDKKGGVETICRYLHYKCFKKNTHMVYNIYTLWLFLKSNNRPERILFFNIYNIFYPLYWLILKIWLPKACFEIQPSWHDPLLQGSTDKSKRDRFKTKLRFLWDYAINYWFIRLFDKVYFYSDYEKNHFNLSLDIDQVITAGPPIFFDKHVKSKNYEYVFVGRIARNKGLNIFLGLAEELKKKTFLIVSPDEIKHSLPQNVKIAINQDYKTVIELMSQSRILICPSYFESYSLVCQDAILLKIGVLASPHVQGKQHFHSYNHFKEFKSFDIHAIRQSLEYLEKTIDSESPENDLFVGKINKFDSYFTGGMS